MIIPFVPWSGVFLMFIEHMAVDHMTQKVLAHYNYLLWAFRCLCQVGSTVPRLLGSDLSLGHLFGPAHGMHVLG